MAAAFLELGLGLVAIVLGWIVGPDAREYMPTIYDVGAISYGIVIGAIAGAALAGAMLLVRRLPWKAIEDLIGIFDEKFMDILGPFSTPQLLTLALTAGVGEELLFRGWLQTWLTGSLVGSGSVERILLGVIVASVMFGFAHPLNVTYIVLASIMGACFGLLYIWTANLLIPIVAHATYDAIIIMKWLHEKEAIGQTSTTFPEQTPTDKS